MKIIVPILGSPNADLTGNGYLKALYEVKEKTIIQTVIDSLSQIKGFEFIFVIRKEDVIKYHIDNILRLLVPGCRIIIAQRETKGSACTCLLAIDYIDKEEPVVISGYNQFIGEDLQKIIESFEKNASDAGVVYFEDINPRWSYVKLDAQGYVTEAAEKNPISKNALTGLFYFRRFSDFIDAAVSMIKKDASVDGQFYISPCLNELVLFNKKIRAYRIDRSRYFNLGSEKGIEDLKRQENC